MKKIIAGLFLCAIVAGSFTSCKKDKKTDCTSATKAVTDALTAYSTSQNSANCKTYKAAIQSYLSSDCATGISADEKAAYEAAISTLTCD